MWETNMKRLFFFTLFFISLSLSAQNAVSPWEIETAALNYARHHICATDLPPHVIQVVASPHQPNPLLYDVQLDNGYGVVLTPVKTCIPVVCYYQYENQHSILTDDNLPDGVSYFIEKYYHEVAYAMDSLSANYPANEAWEWLLNDCYFKDELVEQPSVNYFYYSDLTPTDQTIFGPYIKTQWGQTTSNDGKDHNAYNLYVKETCKDCNGGKCPVGCVALAMAQIMKYWEYPDKSKISSHQYEWKSMPNKLLMSSDNYNEERHQIAKLLIDCGKAAKVNYCYSNTCESFAWPANARDALVDVFGYAPTAKRKLRSSFSTKKWKEILIQDLMNSRPILYGAISFASKNYNQGGHAFICDGYNTQTGFFHFDWGKRGKYSELWLNIDELVCDKKNWNHLERAVVGIKPNK